MSPCLLQALYGAAFVLGQELRVSLERLLHGDQDILPVLARRLGRDSIDI